jgi:hypothetical protein
VCVRERERERERKREKERERKRERQRDNWTEIHTETVVNGMDNSTQIVMCCYGCVGGGGGRWGKTHNTLRARIFCFSHFCHWCTAVIHLVCGWCLVMRYIC